jgi:hypothetical protein
MNYLIPIKTAKRLAMRRQEHFTTSLNVTNLVKLLKMIGANAMLVE